MTDSGISSISAYDGEKTENVARKSQRAYRRASNDTVRHACARGQSAQRPQRQRHREYQRPQTVRARPRDRPYPAGVWALGFSGIEGLARVKLEVTQTQSSPLAHLVEEWLLLG